MPIAAVSHTFKAQDRDYGGISSCKVVTESVAWNVDSVGCDWCLNGWTGRYGGQEGASGKTCENWQLDSVIVGVHISDRVVRPWTLCNTLDRDCSNGILAAQVAHKVISADVDATTLFAYSAIFNKVSAKLEVDCIWANKCSVFAEGVAFRPERALVLDDRDCSLEGYIAAHGVVSENYGTSMPSDDERTCNLGQIEAARRVE